MKRDFFCFLCFVAFSMLVKAQEEPDPTFYNNVNLPESPVAASLGRYEAVPVNLATGVPQINIPIFSFNVDGIEIPISLSYHASGVQVNELPTAVGLNWTLNAGGGIFRSVNSLPDEDGWISPQYGPIPQSFYDSHNHPCEYNYKTAMTGGSMGVGMASYRDHNPDDYTYRFLSHSGKFITDFGNRAIKNENDELYIDFNYTNSIIKDQKGNSYFFGDKKEYSYKKTASVTNSRIRDTSGIRQVIGVNGAERDYGHPTGWLLSKITTKNNKEILFDYDEYWVTEGSRNGNEYTYSSSLTLGNKCDLIWMPYASITKTIGFETPSTINGYNVQLLTQITSESYIIFFQYSEDPNLSGWKKKLDKIIIQDVHSGQTKEFYLEYGAFDGDARLKLKKIYEKNGKDKLPGHKFFYKKGDLPIRYSFKQDFFGYYNGNSNNNSSLVPKHLGVRNQFVTAGFGDFYDNNTNDRSPNLSFAEIGILEEIVYPTGGSAKFYYELNQEYNHYINENQYCGGLRVHTVELKDSLGGVVKTFNYEYTGLVGLSYETDEHFTRTSESGLRYGGSQTYHSGFVVDKNLNQRGYFYKEVTEKQTWDQKTIKKKNNFIQNSSYGTLGHILESEVIFKDNDTLKLVEYEYGRFGNPETIEWNILGDRECCEDETGFHTFMSYRFGYHMQFIGNTTLLPTRIATTDFVYPSKITTLKEIDYDHDTLLKLQEITDMRYTRTGAHQYVLDKPLGERITVQYYYPTVPIDEGFSTDFPKGLVIKQETEVLKNGQAEQTGGHAYAFDSQGNIETVFSFEKRQGSNNSPLSYVPSHYQERTGFLFSDGHPVQVWPKDGIPTSYIWNLTANVPVAKIEGLSRAALNQNLVAQLEQADFAQLPSLLMQLRTTLPNPDKVFLTTYTYKPLAGVETITDPKGYKTTYEYDAFGRLQYVRDPDGNLLNETEYNYALD